jgi:hypothetical protein
VVQIFSQTDGIYVGGAEATFFYCLIVADMAEHVFNEALFQIIDDTFVVLKTEEDAARCISDMTAYMARRNLKINQGKLKFLKHQGPLVKCLGVFLGDSAFQEVTTGLMHTWNTVTKLPLQYTFTFVKQVLLPRMFFIVQSIPEEYLQRFIEWYNVFVSNLLMHFLRNAEVTHQFGEWAKQLTFAPSGLGFVDFEVLAKDIRQKVSFAASKCQFTGRWKPKFSADQPMKLIERRKDIWATFLKGNRFFTTQDALWSNAWLAPPSSPKTELSDDHFSKALAVALRCLKPRVTHCVNTRTETDHSVHGVIAKDAESYCRHVLNCQQCSSAYWMKRHESINRRMARCFAREAIYYYVDPKTINKQGLRVDVNQIAAGTHGKVGPDGMFTTSLGTFALDVSVTSTFDSKYTDIGRRTTEMKKRQYVNFEDNSQIRMQYLIMSLWGKPLGEDTKSFLQMHFSAHGRRVLYVECSVALARDVATQVTLMSLKTSV